MNPQLDIFGRDEYRPAQHAVALPATTVSPSAGILCPALAGSIPAFPIDCPTDAEADAEFKALREMDCSVLIRESEWQSRSVLPFKTPIVVDINTTGSKASDRFHFNARMACDSLASPSPARSWFDLKIRKSVEASQFYEKSHRSALALRKYIPAQFRPSAAKAIYQHFGAARVYDPCGGWGDRLCAALATDSVSLYYARDVNPLVFPGYAEQARRYDGAGKSRVVMLGSEVSAPAVGFFDLVFTSPPYYKVEKYQGDAQSHAKYKGMEQWLNGFLFPMVTHAWQSLRDGGHMAINIADVYADHRNNAICVPLIEYAASNLPGCTLVGIWCYRLAGRVNYRNQLAGVQGEPILIFRKSEAPPVAANDNTPPA